MEIKKIPIDYFVERINNNEPFSFSRFGDGEIICMFNAEYFRSTRHRNMEWLYNCGKELKQIIINNYDYFHGFNRTNFTDARWNGKSPHRGIECLNFLEKNNTPLIYEGDWQGYPIVKITEAINKHNPVFIGGKHLSNIQYLNGITNMQLIKVDDNNAYNQKKVIIDSIMKKYNNGSRMFCFSASVIGKIIIDELYHVIGKDAFMIDFGSLFDPYCGNLSRSGMRNNGFQIFQPFTTLNLL